MWIGDGRPAERGEFGGGVEFHGAGAEWNHGVAGGEVFGGETTNVAEEFGFACIGGEDGVAEGRRLPNEGSGKRRIFWRGLSKKGEGFGLTEKREERIDFRVVSAFVEGDTEIAVG